MKNIAKGKQIKEVLSTETLNLPELESEAMKIIKDKPGLSRNAYMGLLMEKLKGKVSGREVSEVLAKLIKQK